MGLGDLAKLNARWAEGERFAQRDCEGPREGLGQQRLTAVGGQQPRFFEVELEGPAQRVPGAAELNVGEGAAAGAVHEGASLGAEKRSDRRAR